VASLQKNRLEAGLRQSGVKPLRQRPGFESDPNTESQLLEEGDERIGIARNFRFLTILPFASTMQTLESSKDTSMPA